MPNCTASLAASQSPNPHCSPLHLRFGSIGATQSTAHLNPKMSNLFLADPLSENLDEAGGAVYPDSVPGLYFLGCIAASDHGRDAKFTGDDGRV